jgi:hypothetical protein
MITTKPYLSSRVEMKCKRWSKKSRGKKAGAQYTVAGHGGRGGSMWHVCPPSRCGLCGVPW